MLGTEVSCRGPLGCEEPDIEKYPTFSFCHRLFIDGRVLAEWTSTLSARSPSSREIWYTHTLKDFEGTANWSVNRTRSDRHNKIKSNLFLLSLLSLYPLSYHPEHVKRWNVCGWEVWGQTSQSGCGTGAISHFHFREHHRPVENNTDEDQSCWGEAFPGVIPLPPPQNTWHEERCGDSTSRCCLLKLAHHADTVDDVDMEANTGTRVFLCHRSVKQHGITMNWRPACLEDMRLVSALTQSSLTVRFRFHLCTSHRCVRQLIWSPNHIAAAPTA